MPNGDSASYQEEIALAANGTMAYFQVFFRAPYCVNDRIGQYRVPGTYTADEATLTFGVDGTTFATIYAASTVSSFNQGNIAGGGWVVGVEKDVSNHGAYHWVSEDLMRNSPKGYVFSGNEVLLSDPRGTRRFTKQ